MNRNSNSCTRLLEWLLRRLGPRSRPLAPGQLERARPVGILIAGSSIEEKRHELNAFWRQLRAGIPADAELMDAIYEVDLTIKLLASIRKEAEAKLANMDAALLKWDGIKAQERKSEFCNEQKRALQ